MNELGAVEAEDTAPPEALSVPGWMDIFIVFVLFTSGSPRPYSPTVSGTQTTIFFFASVTFSIIPFFFFIRSDIIRVPCLV